MKRILRLGTIILIFFLGVPLPAEELIPAVFTMQVQPRISALSEGIQGRISLDLRKIEINDALKYFALKSGLNIVTTKLVAGRVTLIVEDVIVKDVFDIMLRSNGLAYDKIGNIYNVMRAEEYRKLYGRAFGDVRIVKIFKLKYAIPDQAFSLLDAMKSEIGRILADTESGNILCMDSPQKIKEMEAALAEFEKKSTVRVFTLNYAKAKEIEAQLKPRLDGKKVGSIKANEQSNQVVVQALPERMKEIEKLIKSLDKKTKEVLIDAKIVRVKLGDALDVGVEWEGLFDVSEKNGLTYMGSYPFSSVATSTDDWRSRKITLEGGTTPAGDSVTGVGYVGSYPFSGTTTSFSASRKIIGLDKMHIGIVGAHDFDVLFNYLKVSTEAKILSNPKIAVTNKQEARIHVGQRQAYVTTTTTTGQTTSTVSEEVTFIDIGIQMSVTPTINEQDYVEIKLQTEISSVIDTLITPSGNRIPIVDTSLAETTVLVKGGATVVIGGLRKDVEGETIRRVPILSKIPILGLLFQTKQSTKDHTELLIMITPTIISGDALVEAEGEEIGGANIKSMQEYGELERRKKELQTHKPRSGDFGGMELKGFKFRTEQPNTNIKK